MTIFLVLGFFAGLYLLWLLFSLAVYALPVASGIVFALWMRDHGYGYFAAVLGGFAAGVAVLVIACLLFAVTRPGVIRLALALLFVIPAGIAGYHAAQGVIGLAIDRGTTLSVLSWIGGIIIAAAAWIRLACAGISEAARPRPGPPPRSHSNSGRPRAG